MSLQGKMKVINITDPRQFKSINAEMIGLKVSTTWKFNLNEHVLVNYNYHDGKQQVLGNNIFLIKGIQPCTSLLRPGKLQALLLHLQGVIQIQAIK